MCMYEAFVVQGELIPKFYSLLGLSLMESSEKHTRPSHHISSLRLIRNAKSIRSRVSKHTQILTHTHTHTYINALCEHLLITLHKNKKF